MHHGFFTETWWKSNTVQFCFMVECKVLEKTDSTIPHVFVLMMCLKKISWRTECVQNFLIHTYLLHHQRFLHAVWKIRTGQVDLTQLAAVGNRTSHPACLWPLSKHLLVVFSVKTKTRQHKSQSDLCLCFKWELCSSKMQLFSKSWVLKNNPSCQKERSVHLRFISVLTKACSFKA